VRCAAADWVEHPAWIATKNLQVFSLWHADLPGFEVDLFAEEPFDFDLAWERRVDVALKSTYAPTLCLEDLLDLKRAAGRAQDLEDVAALESLPGGDVDV
jgi:hypothetical protein